MRSVAWALFALSGLPLIAQQEASPEGKFSLKGTVTDSITGQPIRRALVTAMPIALPKSWSCLTDSEGRFSIEQVPEGNYQVKVRRPGYEDFSTDDLPRDGDENRAIEVGPSRDNLAYRLLPLAVVYGRVSDDSGDPVPNVEVEAIRRTTDGGVRKVAVIAWDQTDDRGRFRIAELSHERIFVKAAGKAGGTRVYMGAGAPEDDVSEAFAPVYYSSASELTSATPIDPKPGTETEVDLHLKIEPGYRIAGSIANMSLNEQAQVELFRGEEFSTTPVLLNASNGRFSVNGVVPGRYLLRASQRRPDGRRQAGEVQVQVVRSNVSGVTISLAPGIDVPVHIQPEGAGTGPLRGFRQLSLVPAITAGNGVEYHSGYPAEGGLSFMGVLPGKYRLKINRSAGAYISSATCGNIDLLGTDLLVGDGAGCTIEVVLRYDGGQIEGEVSNNGKSAVGARVVLAPADGRQIHEMVLEADRKGAYVMKGIAPGLYRLYATEPGRQLDPDEPAATQLLQSAPQIEVTPNGRTTANLRVAEQQR